MLTFDGLVDIPFTQTEVTEANHGRLLFDIYGHIVYDDVFGQRHMTRFCQVYDPSGNNGQGGFTFPREAKSEYNDAD